MSTLAPTRPDTGTTAASRPQSAGPAPSRSGAGLRDRGTPVRPARPVDTRFRDDIQGLRGIAVLLVVAFHLETFAVGGFLGVDMFFVLSGYVITVLLVKELQETGALSLRRFYARRIRRLLPIFALFSVATTIIAAFAIDGPVVRESVADTGRAAAVFLANVELESNGGGYFSPVAELNPFLHTWSLSVEEQFYLVFPLLVLVAWRLSRRPAQSVQAVKIVLALAVVASFAAATVTVLDDDLRAAFYRTPLRGWEFGVGALLAMNSRSLLRISKRVATALAVAGAALVGGAVLLLTTDSPWPGPYALAPVVGTALLIAGGSTDSPVQRALGTKPLVWLGDRSYGWYLWHWPAIVLARLTWPDSTIAPFVTVAASLALTEATYRFVEQPIRHNDAIRGLAVVVLFGIAVNGPVGAATLAKEDAGIELQPVEGEFGLFTRAWDDGCTNLPWDEETCTYPTPGATGTVLVLGDSLSTVQTDVVTAAAAEVGLSTVVHTMFGCPAFPRGVRDGGLDGGDSCLRYQEGVHDVIDRVNPSIVFLTHWSTHWTQPDEGRPLLDAQGEVITDADRALAEWSAAAREFFGRVDVPILLMATVPEFDEGAAALIAGGQYGHPDLYITRAQLDERRGAVLATEIAAANDDGSVLVFDPAPFLCDEAGCRAHQGDRWMYLDHHHMRAIGTAVFGDAIAEGFVSLLQGLPSDANG